MSRHLHRSRFISIKLRVLIALALMACVVATFSVATFIGSAATPSSGTLSTATPLLTYTAGPFLVSNPSAQAGPADCVTLPCDEYTLTVTGLPNLGTTHDVVVTVQWDVAAEDYDLYIRQGGVDIKNSASSSDPEIATIDANPGIYTIRVIPFAVAGSSFNAKVELVPKPTNPPPPPPGPGTPRYHNFAATGTLGNSAGEPSLGVGSPIAGHPDGRTMYIAGLQTLRVTWDDCSSPAKPLWEDVSFPTTSTVSLDPILFSDFATGRTLVSQLGPKTSFLAFTDNDGGVDGQAPGDWTPSQGSGINSGVDHQTVGGGPFVPGLPDGTGLYANAVYYASQDVAVAQAAISRDGGLSFGPAVPMYNLTQCGGLHGHIKVAPDGTVYMPNKGCGGTQGVVVSSDEGVTWTVRPVPGSSPGDTDPAVGIDSTGKVYFSFANGNGHAMVAVSSNKGVTWSTPIDVGTAFSIKNTVFPAAVGGGPGRAAVMYLATDTGGNYEQLGVFPGVWHIYAAHTFDGGASWTTVRVTPENDPVQRGSICTSGTTCGADRNLLDFNDIGVDHEGRTLIAYADGCIGCTSPTGADSRTDKATIARQSGGKRLFAAFDPSPAEPKAPAAPQVTSVAGDPPGDVHIDWEEPDNGGSPLTGYNVYRRTEPGVYGAPLATVTIGCPACKTDYDDTTAVSGVAYRYKVTAVNAQGEGTNCGEFAIGLAPHPDTPCELDGMDILEDATGDSLDMQGSHDVEKLSIAELYAFRSPDRLVFVLKMADLSGPLPPNTKWPIEFDSNGNRYVVQMSTFAPNTPATPGFEYDLASALVPANIADPASTYTADGTITIIVPRSGVGNPAVGQNLTGFLVRIAYELVGVTITPDNMPDSLAPTGSYTVVGNAFCRPNDPPIPILAANPTSGTEPLLVNFDGSGSFDPDTDAPPDTIASYTFNFGDGTSETRTVAMFGAAAAMTTHTYMDDGVYQATLRVTDSRGMQSLGVADVVINVEEAGGLVNYALISRGSTASASSTATARNYSAASAFDGDSTGVGWETGGGWNDNTRGIWPDNLDVTFGGGAKTISEIRVYTLQNNYHSPTVPDENTDASVYGILDFQVQTWNGLTWVTVPGGMITSNTKALTKITLGAPINTTKVRVLVTNGRVHYSRIVELECYGAAGQ